MEGTDSNVVFLVSGRDEAGKRILIKNMVEENMLELDPVNALKMEEIQIFAVSPKKVIDIASSDASNNFCPKQETILFQGGCIKGEESISEIFIINNIIFLFFIHLYLLLPSFILR